MAAFVLKIISKWKRITKLLVGSIGLFCASCMCFCSGITNENSIIESAAVSISNFASTNTKTSCLSIQVSPKNADAKKTLPDTYNEYFYWKYIFRHSDFSFLSTVNGGKTHNCYFDEIEANNNISFIFCGNNSNKAYEGFYKHEVYDIKLMFRGINSINKDAINFFAISQSRADQLLLKRGELPDDDGKYGISQYEKLLGTNTQLNIDSQPYLFTISNVFFESGTLHNNLEQNFGEYVISYIRFPDLLEFEATYIFNTYNYQNIHKIKRMREIFNSANFSFNLSSYNLNNNNTQLSDVFNYSYIFGGVIGNNFLSIFLLIMSFVLLVTFLYFIWLCESIHNIKNIAIVVVSFLLPYIILSLINLIINVPLAFSYFSLVPYLIMTIIFILVLVLILFRKRGESIRKLL